MGYVEDIGFLDMVIKTWDERRIIMPLRKLIGSSFENWSLESDKQVRSVDLFVDYNLDLNKVREEYHRILKNSSQYDHQVEPLLQVVDCNADSMNTRVLCGAANPFSAWNLQCLIREEFLDYIAKTEEGKYLAQTRHTLMNKNL